MSEKPRSYENPWWGSNGRTLTNKAEPVSDPISDGVVLTPSELGLDKAGEEARRTRIQRNNQPEKAPWW